MLGFDDNENGVLEAIYVDENSDLKFDYVLFDTNEDGKTDLVGYDLDDNLEPGRIETVRRRPPTMRIAAAILAGCLRAAASVALALYATPSACAAAQPAAESQVEMADRVIQLYIAGRYEEALALAEKGLAIGEKEDGPDSANVASWLTHMALALEGLGRYEEAIPHLKRALAIREKVLGTRSPRHRDRSEQSGGTLRQSGPLRRSGSLQQARARNSREAPRPRPPENRDDAKQSRPRLHEYGSLRRSRSRCSSAPCPSAKKPTDPSTPTRRRAFQI